MSALQDWSVAEVLEPLGDGDTLPLPKLRKVLPGDVHRNDLIYAMRRGVLEASPMPGRRDGAHEVTRSEAECLVLAAIIAIAAGVALATALQVVKGAGLTPASLGAAVST